MTKEEIDLPKEIYFSEKVGSNGIHCLDYKNESDVKYIREDLLTDFSQQQRTVKIKDGKILSEPKRVDYGVTHEGGTIPWKRDLDEYQNAETKVLEVEDYIKLEDENKKLKHELLKHAMSKSSNKGIAESLNKSELKQYKEFIESHDLSEAFTEYKNS